MIAMIMMMAYRFKCSYKNDLDKISRSFLLMKVSKVANKLIAC